MSGTPLLDTHAWIWWVEHDSRLGGETIEALDGFDAAGRPYLCDVSIWEVARLVGRGRLSFDVPLAEWLDAAAHPRSVRVIPVVPAIAAEVSRLPEMFQRDPADGIIVATSRVIEAPLLTHDRRIIQSRLVKRWTPSSKSA